MTFWMILSIVLQIVLFTILFLRIDFLQIKMQDIQKLIVNAKAKARKDLLN